MEAVSVLDRNIREIVGLRVQVAMVLANAGISPRYVNWNLRDAATDVGVDALALARDVTDALRRAS